MAASPADDTCRVADDLLPKLGTKPRIADEVDLAKQQKRGRRFVGLGPAAAAHDP